jgi:hypothetical protein
LYRYSLRYMERTASPEQRQWMQNEAKRAVYSLAFATTYDDRMMSRLNAGRVWEYGSASVRPVLPPLVRDIFGNPFRRVRVVPRWLTSPVSDLARTMYDTRDFGAMPILADALEEAGCDNPDVLAHCRGDGPHVRGCWVVDLILGKG